MPEECSDYNHADSFLVDIHFIPFRYRSRITRDATLFRPFLTEPYHNIIFCGVRQAVNPR